MRAGLEGDFGDLIYQPELMLEPARAPVEVVAIDGAERPTQN